MQKRQLAIHMHIVKTQPATKRGPKFGNKKVKKGWLAKLQLLQNLGHTPVAEGEQGKCTACGKRFSARTALVLARHGKCQGQPESMRTKASQLGLPTPPSSSSSPMAVPFGANAAHASHRTEYRKGILFC